MRMCTDVLLIVYIHICIYICNDVMLIVYIYIYMYTRASFKKHVLGQDQEPEERS